MWRIVKGFILLWPAAVMIYFIADTVLDRATVAEHLSNANGLVWGSGDDLVTVRVDNAVSGERTTYRLSVIDGKERTLLEEEFTVDSDMFGGGFVKAGQVDEDEELEVIAWGAHEGQTSFFLDYSEEGTSRRPFDDASEEVQRLAELWHQTYVMAFFGFFMLGFLFSGYYVVVVIVWAVVQAFRRHRVRAVEAKAP